MKRLPPAKRNQLIMVLLITAALIGSVYFFLIGPENDANRKLGSDTSDRLADLDKYKKIIKQADATAKQLVDITARLNRTEQDVATGDVYSWTYDTIRRFKAAYNNVQIPTSGQPSVSDVDLIPNFPYKQVRVSLNGTAYYQDLGKFIADFENNFPHIRLVNLMIEPVGQIEQLNFHVDMVALVKPNS
jgi:Tfp pilus assembly protein PilO